MAPSGEWLWGEGLVWLVGAVVCLLAAWCTVQHPSRLCQSAATSKIFQPSELPVLDPCCCSNFQIISLAEITSFQFQTWLVTCEKNAEIILKLCPCFISHVATALVTSEIKH